MIQNSSKSIMGGPPSPPLQFRSTKLQVHLKIALSMEMYQKTKPLKPRVSSWNFSALPTLRIRPMDRVKKKKEKRMRKTPCSSIQLNKWTLINPSKPNSDFSFQSNKCIFHVFSMQILQLFGIPLYSSLICYSLISLKVKGKDFSLRVMKTSIFFFPQKEFWGFKFEQKKEVKKLIQNIWWTYWRKVKINLKRKKNYLSQ